MTKTMQTHRSPALRSALDAPFDDAAAPDELALLAGAKWAFTTRNVRREDACGLSRHFGDARPGDVLMARTLGIGQHTKVQLASGRNSENVVGDVVVMVVGDRYAPDQFEGVAEIDPDDCSVIAGGGLVGRVAAAHARMDESTALEPIALLCDARGDVLNIADYALAARTVPERTVVIGVFGTSMNSGKTTTSMSLALGLRRAGLEVAGVKATGTGAFGDYNAFDDAGVPVFDFVDAGMGSTYRMPLERIEAGFETLVGTAAANGADVVVVEIADGVFQHETRQILEGSRIRDRLDGVLFAAADSAGAVGGVGVLRALGIEPLGVSGLVTCSPLGARETRAALGLPLIERDALRDGAEALALLGNARRRGVTAGRPGAKSTSPAVDVTSSTASLGPCNGVARPAVA